MKDISAAAGKLVCMSSVHQEIPWASHANYAASQGGVMQMMRSVAQEVAPLAIRVKGVAPGIIRTPISRPAWETKEVYENLMTLVPYKRIGEPEVLPSSCLACLRCGRLRHGRAPVHRRWHDAVPRVCDRRLGSRLSGRARKEVGLATDRPVAPQCRSLSCLVSEPYAAFRAMRISILHPLPYSARQRLRSHSEHDTQFCHCNGRRASATSFCIRTALIMH